MAQPFEIPAREMTAQELQLLQIHNRRYMKMADRAVIWQEGAALRFAFVYDDSPRPKFDFGCGSYEAEIRQALQRCSTVVHWRSGGPERFRWHATLPMSAEAAAQALADTRRMGYAAHLADYGAELPTTYEV